MSILRTPLALLADVFEIPNVEVARLEHTRGSEGD